MEGFLFLPSPFLLPPLVSQCSKWKRKNRPISTTCSFTGPQRVFWQKIAQKQGLRFCFRRVDSHLNITLEYYTLICTSAQNYHFHLQCELGFRPLVHKFSRLTLSTIPIQGGSFLPRQGGRLRQLWSYRMNVLYLVLKTPWSMMKQSHISTCNFQPD